MAKGEGVREWWVHLTKKFYDSEGGTMELTGPTLFATEIKPDKEFPHELVHVVPKSELDRANERVRELELKLHKIKSLSVPYQMTNLPAALEMVQNLARIHDIADGKGT